MPALDRAQVAAYVQAHLQYAGTEQAIFSHQALDAIDRYASGAARLVDKACTHAPLYGAKNGYRVIDERIITRVIQGELA